MRINASFSLDNSSESSAKTSSKAETFSCNGPDFRKAYSETKSRADSQEQEWEAANDSFEQCSKGHFADLLGDEAGFDYVFANADTGPPYTNVGKAFGPACREAGIQDLTFHDLRHTFASRLREADVDAITT
jgi:integrase